MRNADSGELTPREMAERRWSPEVRLRSAVDYTAEHAAELNDAQRAMLEAAITTGGDDSV
jgi:hypothetical protein